MTGLADDTARDGDPDADAAMADDPPATEEGAGVREGELPPPEPDARPVKDASVGALDAWLLPIVAYALPS